jgi:hypothetical protein
MRGGGRAQLTARAELAVLPGHLTPQVARALGSVKKRAIQHQSPLLRGSCTAEVTRAVVHAERFHAQFTATVNQCRELSEQVYTKLEKELQEASEDSGCGLAVVLYSQSEGIAVVVNEQLPYIRLSKQLYLDSGITEIKADTGIHRELRTALGSNADIMAPTDVEVYSVGPVKHFAAPYQKGELGKCRKLRAVFFGPYKVIRWRGPATLQLDLPQNIWPRKSGDALFPVSRVKPYFACANSAQPPSGKQAGARVKEQAGGSSSRPPVSKAPFPPHHPLLTPHLDT